MNSGKSQFAYLQYRLFQRENNMIELVISGGQTGADMGGLLGAKDARFVTGGYAPICFKTEEGCKPSLGKDFGLVDSKRDYSGRTELNVLLADVTLWFGDENSHGGKVTFNYCTKHLRPFVNASYMEPNEIAEYLSQNDYSIINIAGNRESRCNGIQENTRLCVKQFLTLYKQMRGVSMIPEVVNIRTCYPRFGIDGDVRIDRGSKWGNPFLMKSESDRERVLRLYEEHIRDNPMLLSQICELASAKRLGCWCKPRACHGDILVRILTERGYK